MKFLKKQSVAITVMILAIVAAALIGIGRGPVGAAPEPDHQPGQNAYALDDLPTGEYDRWLQDAANVLSSGTEEKLSRYNANWDARYHSVVAVLTVNQVNGDIADVAYDYGYDIGLGENDAILLRDYPELFVQGLYNGIQSYFNNFKTVADVTPEEI